MSASGRVIEQGLTGQMTSQAQTNPGAAAEWAYTVPAGHTMVLLTVHFQLVTSAVVANRSPHLTVKDSGGNIVHLGQNGISQVASTTVDYTASQGGPVGAVGGPATGIALPFPIGLVLPAGWSIGTSTTGLQAGDQFQAIQLAGLYT